MKHVVGHDSRPHLFVAITGVHSLNAKSVSCCAVAGKGLTVVASVLRGDYLQRAAEIEEVQKVNIVLLSRCGVNFIVVNRFVCNFVDLYVLCCSVRYRSNFVSYSLILMILAMFVYGGLLFRINYSLSSRNCVQPHSLISTKQLFRAPWNTFNSDILTGNSIQMLTGVMFCISVVSKLTL